MPHSDRSQSRRTFLAGLGATGAVLRAPRAAAATSADSSGAPGTASGTDSGVGQFVRMFDDLAPFAEPDDELREALIEVGRPGGIMDAADPLEIGPIRLITEPERSPSNLNNQSQTAGSTFMGQFLDHDITRDADSPLGVPTAAERSLNLRSARFDLDTIYGGGPELSPELYEDNTGRFRVESGGLFEDLPRRADNTAIVAEARNDENLMISGLQVAFLQFHNAVLDRHLAGEARIRIDRDENDGPRRRRGGRSDGSSRGDRPNRRSDRDDRTAQAFAGAQRQVQWHYQWLILHQFLPQFVGQQLVDDIMLNGRRHFRPAVARIPLEFQSAAYRFGHSMIRPSYRANMAGDNGEPFFAMVFDVEEMGKPDPNDLSGRSRAPRRFIGWQTFFDFADGEVKPNKRIDTSISTPMFNLPIATIPSPRGEDVGPTSLATRNLLRHITWQLPSGQAIAEHMGSPILSVADLSDIGDIKASLATSTPLWFYILREADILADGQHLGPVGGRIVAEVFIALLQMDPTSWLSLDPAWRPDLPSASVGDFTMTDLLTLAGVDPVSRGQ